MRTSAAFLLVLAGCGIFGPTEATFLNRRALDPPPRFSEWYHAVELCRSVSGDYGAVRWFVADSIWYEGETAGGAIDRGASEITIRADLLLSEVIVRHEADHHVTDAGNEAHLPDGGMLCDGKRR